MNTTLVICGIIVIGIAALFLKIRKNFKGAPVRPFEGEVNPSEVVILADGNKANGLCFIFSNMISQTLKKKPRRYGVLLSMDTSIGIEDIKTNTAALTMTFSGGKVVLRNGIENPKIYIGTDPQTLMDFQQMKKSIGEIMKDETSKSIIRKYFRGELKLKGLFSNFADFQKFTMLLK